LGMCTRLSGVPWLLIEICARSLVADASAGCSKGRCQHLQIEGRRRERGGTARHGLGRHRCRQDSSSGARGGCRRKDAAVGQDRHRRGRDRAQTSMMRAGPNRDYYLKKRTRGATHSQAGIDLAVAASTSKFRQVVRPHLSAGGLQRTSQHPRIWRLRCDRVEEGARQFAAYALGAKLSQRPDTHGSLCVKRRLVLGWSWRVREVTDPKCRCRGVSRPRWMQVSPPGVLPGSPRAV